MDKTFDIQVFNFNAPDQAQEWQKWSKRFNLSLTLLSKKKLSPEKKLAALRLWGGVDLDALIDRLLKNPSIQSPSATIPHALTEELLDMFQWTVQLLDQHFLSKSNSMYSMSMFRSMKQEPNETIGAFGARLRKQASLCNLGDQEMILQVFAGATATSIRKKAAKAKDFEKLISVAEIEEEIEKQLAPTGPKQNEEEVVAYVRSERFVGGGRVARPGYRGTVQRATPYAKCTNCGGSHTAGSTNCAAKGKSCHSCKMVGHLADYCRITGGKFAAKIPSRGGNRSTYVPRAEEHRRAEADKSVNMVKDEGDEHFIPGPPNEAQV